MKRINQTIHLACAGSNAVPVKKQTRLLTNVVFCAIALCAVAKGQTWQVTVPGSLGSRFDNGAATGPDGKVYIMGGYSGFTFQRYKVMTPNPLVEQYAPLTNTVTGMAGMNTPRAYQATVTGCDGKIYAIGGLSTPVSGVLGAPLSSVEAYDTNRNTWTTVAPLNADSGIGLVATVGKDCNIYVFGVDEEVLDGAWAASSSGPSWQWAYNSVWATSALPLPPEAPFYATVTDYTGNIYGVASVAGSSPPPTAYLYQLPYPYSKWTDCSRIVCNPSSDHPSALAEPNPITSNTNPADETTIVATLGGDGNIYIVDTELQQGVQAPVPQVGDLYSDLLPNLASQPALPPCTAPDALLPVGAPGALPVGSCPPPHSENFAMTTAEGQMLVVGGDRLNVATPAVDSYGPMPANLLPYQDFWKFDGNLSDLVNTGCTASVVPASQAASIYTGGRVGQALLLNGKTNLNLPEASCGDIGAGDFSIEFWINPLSSPTGVVESILDKRTLTSAGYHGYQVYLYDGKIGLQMDDGSYENYGSYINIPTAGWTHVAITVARQNGETAAGFIWVNGVMAAQFTPMSGSLSSAANLNIGLDTLGDQQYYSGQLDELTIYNRALTFAEVRSVIMAGQVGKATPAVGCSGGICN